MPVTGFTITPNSTYNIYDVTTSLRSQNADVDGETFIIRGTNGQVRPQRTTVDGSQTITGTVTVDATNDKLLILIDREDAVEVTLTHGARSLSQILIDINLALEGNPATAVSNAVRFTADFRVDIQTIANDAYTLLGLTVANTSNRILFKASQIRIRNTVEDHASGGIGNDHDSPFSFQPGNSRERSAQSKLELEDTSLICEEHTVRRNLWISRFQNAVVKEEGTNRLVFLYTPVNAELDQVVFAGIRGWEVVGVPAIASGLTFDNCDAGPFNYEAGRLDLIGVNVVNFRSDGPHAWFGTGNSGNNQTYFWNPTAAFDFRKILRERSEAEAFLGYTFVPKFIDVNGDIEDATLVYRDDRATTGTFVERGTYTTDEDGQLTGEHDSQQGTDGDDEDRPVLWLLTRLTVHNASGAEPVTIVLDTRTVNRYDIQEVTPRLEFRSYGHLPLSGYGEDDDFTITAPLGVINADGSAAETSVVFVTIDDAITEDDRDTVDAYTELDSAAEAYDRLKSVWVSDGDVSANGPYCGKDGDILDFGSRDVTLSTTASDVVDVDGSGNVTLKTGTTFDGGFLTTGTVTVGQGIVVEGSINDSTGITIVFDGFPAAHDGVIGAWPTADGETDRSNIVNGKIPIIHRTDLSVTADTRTVFTAAGDFSIFFVGSTVKLFRFDEDDNNGNFEIESIASDGRSMVLTRTDGNSFVDETAGSNRKCISDQTSTSITIKLTADTEYFFVADAISYLRSTASRFDTGDITTVNVSLRKIVDASGNDLIEAEEDLSDDEFTRFHQIEYDVDNDRIIFDGTSSQQVYTFTEVARAIEVGQSSEAALANQYVILISTGSFTLESGAERKFQRKSGLASSIVPDCSGFQYTQVGSTDPKDVVDYDNGAIIVNTGNPSVVSLSGVSESDFHGYLDDYPNKDDYKATGSGGGLDQTTFNTRMANVPDATKDTYKGTGTSSYSESNLHSHLDSYTNKDNWKATVTALTNSTYGLSALKTLIDTIDTVVDANKALLENGTHGLAALKTLLDTISGYTDILDDSGNGLAAIKTAVDAIPDSHIDQTTFNARLDAYGSKDDWKADVSSLATSAEITALNDVSTSAIVTAIQAMDASSASGTQTLASVLDAIKSVVDDNNTHLEHGTYGLSALRTLLTTIDTVVDANKANLEHSDHGLANLKTLIDTVDTVADANKALLENGTHGLEALKDLIDGRPSATAIAEAVRDLEIVTGLNLLQTLRVLVSIGGGRVSENTGDSDLLDIYSLVDDNLVVTIPKFENDVRASGATVP